MPLLTSRKSSLMTSRGNSCSMVTNDDEIMVVRLQSMVPPRCVPRSRAGRERHLADGSGTAPPGRAVRPPNPIHHLCNALIKQATKGSGKHITETYQAHCWQLNAHTVKLQIILISALVLSEFIGTLWPPRQRSTTYNNMNKNRNKDNSFTSIDIPFFNLEQK